MSLDEELGLIEEHVKVKLDEYAKVYKDCAKNKDLQRAKQINLAAFNYINSLFSDEVAYKRMNYNFYYLQKRMKK
jgi:hypothetical protein